MISPLIPVIFKVLILLKLVLIETDLAPRQISIWNPARSNDMYFVNEKNVIFLKVND
jgi:hypothetical protein